MSESLPTGATIKTLAASYQRPPTHFYTNVNNNDDPFINIIEDEDELKELFRLWPLVPYSGTEQNPQHSLLNTLKILAELGPTQNLVINSMGWYMFGGKVNVAESVDSEFAITGKVYEESQAKPVFDILKLIKPKHGFRGLAKRLFRSRKYSGEHYCIVRFYELAGTRTAKIDSVDNLKIQPLIPEAGKPRMFMVAESFTHKFLVQKKYEIIGEYPFITQTKDGYATIIQYKNTNGLRGRPEERAIMMDNYREYRDNIFLTRQSANNFTPQVFIEYEVEDPSFPEDENKAAIERGFKGTGDRWDNETTNKGEKPKTVIVATRPKGSSPTLIHEFAIQTSEKWFEKIGNSTEARILKAHGWPKDFLDSDMSTGFSQSAHFDKLIVKMPFIEAQAMIETETINKAIDAAFEWMGIDIMNDKDIRFNTPFQTLLEQYNESKSTNDKSIDQNSKIEKTLDQ